MAGLPPQAYYDPFGKVDFESHDYAIGGKMVVATTSMSDDFYQLTQTDTAAKERVKFDLVTQIAKYMVENRLVEFTQYKDPIMGNTRVACRVCLVPDEQVKILRLARKV